MSYFNPAHRMDHFSASRNPKSNEQVWLRKLLIKWAWSVFLLKWLAIERSLPDTKIKSHWLLILTTTWRLKVHLSSDKPCSYFLSVQCQNNRLFDSAWNRFGPNNFKYCFDLKFVHVLFKALSFLLVCCRYCFHVKFNLNQNYYWLTYWLVETIKSLRSCY